MSSFGSEGNFLDTYLSYCQNSECPMDFHLWSGLFAVSAALGRRVFIDMNLFTIYPNLFVILVAGSGRYRKSTAVNLAARFLRRMEPAPNMIAQKTTTEALIEALRVQDVLDEKVILKTKCEGILVVPELASFLNKNTYEQGLGALLIDLYDCDDVYEYRTKGGGRQVLREIFFSILGASTVDWLTNAIPEAAIGAGLTSRIIFVSVTDIPEPVPTPTVDKSSEQKLVSALQRISMLSGQFRFEKRAIELYHTEYVKWFKTSKLFEDKFMSGYASRRMIHQLKLCMLLSASDNAELVIRVEHLEMAGELLARIEPTMPLVMSLLTSTEQGNMVSWVLRLVNSGMTRRSEVLRVVSNKINSQELDVLITTLEQSGQLLTELRGGEVFLKPGPNLKGK